MKKILALILTVCCLSVLLCFPVNAAGEKEVLLVVEKSGGDITVDISTNFKCGAIQGAVKYDGDNIEYDSAAVNSGIEENNAVASSFKNSSGTTRVALVGDSLSGTENNWANITYSADESTPALFDFTALKVFDKGGNKLTDVTAITVMYGDVDNNGLITLIDLVRFKKVLSSGATVEAGKERNLDVNKDGTGSQADDMTELRKNLLK